VNKSTILAAAGGAILATAVLAGGVAIRGGSAAFTVTPSTTSASMAALLDWSGVWSLSDDSAKLATEDSFGTDGGRVPLTPKYLAMRNKAHADHAQNNMSKCLPGGTPGILQHGVLHEYLLTPGRVTMLTEDGEVRRIYTDGRQHRPLSDMKDSFMGDSIGHWEGRVLVVDTIGFPNGSLFQNHGLLATLHSHLVERIFKNAAGQMQIDSTLSDPTIFTTPYKYTRKYDRSPLPMEEPICQAGNRDTGETIDLTPPPEE
jgi:hypothetical protein